MKSFNKLFLSVLFVSFIAFMTACGGAKANEIVGKWALADVQVDMESLPEEAKAKMADPAMKPMMDAMIQEMVKQGMTFEFKADGNAVVTMRGKEEAGTYEYKDKKLTISDAKGPKTLDVTELTSTDMAFKMEEGGMKMTMKFKKQ